MLVGDRVDGVRQPRDGASAGEALVAAAAIVWCRISCLMHRTAGAAGQLWSHPIFQNRGAATYETPGGFRVLSDTWDAPGMRLVHRSLSKVRAPHREPAGISCRARAPAPWTASVASLPGDPRRSVADPRFFAQPGLPNPPRHRRGACSMAWRCRFLTARPSQDGRVVAEK